jgi:Na+/H+ antiporter NhaC
MISDTATQSLGTDLKDKFKINLFIAFPAAMITILLFFIWFKFGYYGGTYCKTDFHD